MRKVVEIGFLLCVSTLCLAEECKPLADAGVVSCEGASSGGGISKWVTSATGVSAAVELRVAVTGSGNHRRCVTSWNLHVRGKDRKQLTVTVAEREDHPGDDEWVQENSFEMEAWSRDGKMLLLSQIESQGDWDETTPITFDFDSGSFRRVELHSLFKKRIPPDCYVVYRALRFSNDGRVLISAVSTDDDRESGTKPCFAESLWKLNAQDSSIVPVSSSPKH